MSALTKPDGPEGLVGYLNHLRETKTAHMPPLLAAAPMSESTSAWCDGFNRALLLVMEHVLELDRRPRWKMIAPGSFTLPDYDRPVREAYALKHSHDGSEWIQEFDSREEAIRVQSYNGGVLMRREPLPGQPGLWWVEVTQ